MPEISLFPNVVVAWCRDPGLPVAPLLAQTITIALANDLKMLLLETPYHPSLISLLRTRRAALGVVWV